MSDSNNDLFEREDSDYDTYIAPDIKFSGNIHFEKPFIVKGQISGNIEATSDLVIDTDAIVNADISAERVLIRGKVKGNVIGNKLIFITASGSLDGDITTGKVVLEPGCVFTGKCSMVRNENEK